MLLRSVFLRSARGSRRCPGLGFRLGRLLRERRREIGFADPAGHHARLHDELFALLAGELEAVEEAGLALRLAVLALGPAGEIVGGATGEVFHRLDAVLAERDQ